MRIAFITPEFITEEYFSGGLGNYVFRVSKALVRMGHKVHVLTLSKIDNSEFIYDGIHIHRLVNKTKRWMIFFRLLKLSNTFEWICFSFMSYKKLKLLNKKNKIDLIQFPNSRACGLVSILLLRIPQVIRISCYRPFWNQLAGISYNLDARVIEWLEWIQLRISKHIYSPSIKLKNILMKKAKIHNVKVIRTPIYLETLKWDSSLYNKFLKDKEYLLYIGRFQLHKGFHILAQALNEILSKNSNIYIVFAGLDSSTKLASSMKEYALSLCGKNKKHLIFLGQIPHSQLYPIIDGSKVVVLPSLIDNLPNTCLEAMSLGKSVIGTFGTSFEEIITDGKNGFLVPPNDVKALIDKVNKEWENPNLEKIGNAAKIKILEFHPDRTVRELLIYFQEIIQQNKKQV